MLRINADVAASLAVHLGCLFALVVVAALVRRRAVEWRFVAIALGGLALSLGALFVDPLAPLTRDWHLHWNWGGKIFSTLVILAVMWACPATFDDMGARRWDGRGWRAALACLGVMCALDWTISFAFAEGSRSLSIEKLLFEATLPGINEELIYRGFAMTMLERAFGGATRTILGAPMGAAVLVTSLFFGIQHGTGFDGGHFVFDAPTIALTGTLGLLLAYLRARTGSLVAPAIAHNVVNVGHVLAG